MAFVDNGHVGVLVLLLYYSMQQWQRQRQRQRQCNSFVCIQTKPHGKATTTKQPVASIVICSSLLTKNKSCHLPINKCRELNAFGHFWIVTVNKWALVIQEFWLLPFGVVSSIPLHTNRSNSTRNRTGFQAFPHHCIQQFNGAHTISNNKWNAFEIAHRLEIESDVNDIEWRPSSKTTNSTAS